MALFTTTSLLPAPDLEVNMYTHLPDVPQWLPTQSLPMSSSSLNSAYQSTPQSSSPLQLSSPCTPSGSAGSMLSGFGSMPCGSLPPDPFYNQPPMDSYQPLIDDYYNMSYHPTTSPFVNYAPTPEGNIGKLISQLSSCLQQVAGKDFDASRDTWENFVQEFFDDNALFSVEIDGCGEKQRYVLSRENLPGYFHTFSEDGVSNLQYMLGEGQMNNFQELFRMNYSGATCIVDYTKPHSVKVISEGRLLVDMKLDDNFKITLWYFKVHKYNEFIQRSGIFTKDDQRASDDIKKLSENISTYGLPGATCSYLKKHGMYKVDSLDDVLLSPMPSRMSPTSLVAPVANSSWLPDPYTTGTYTTYSNIHSRVSSLPNHASVDFVPPKSRPKGRHWSSNYSNDKLKKHRSKDKKRRRPPSVLMYIVGEALTLRDGRLLQSISDNEERKITCIKNSFESPEQLRRTLSLNQTCNTQTTSTASVLTNSVKHFNSDTAKLDNRHFPPIPT
ncbi:LIM domain-binding protein 2-like [Dysidea avara]|uniref:LIM domain-binding protein 2-like n=1 Tax=Dysidea avara TaxID=196820 RepID=UPI003327E714